MNIDKLLEIYDRTLFNNYKSIHTFIDTFTDLERDIMFVQPIVYEENVKFLMIGNIKSIDFTVAPLLKAPLLNEKLKIKTVRFKLIDKVTKNQDQLEEFLIKEILEHI